MEPPTNQDQREIMSQILTEENKYSRKVLKGKHE